MPTFGALNRPSGVCGNPGKRSTGYGANIYGVSNNGIGKGVGSGVVIAYGTGSNISAANRSAYSPRKGVVFKVFFDRKRNLYKFVVNGITPTGATKDSTGTPLGGCRVDLFETGSNMFIQSTTSDGSGNYSFYVNGNSSTYYCRAYKAGATNLFGTTDEIITAT